MHHHRQVYETWALLFVLRHIGYRKSAGRRVSRDLQARDPMRVRQVRKMAPREVLATSSLPLQGSACAVSAIGANWYARPELNWHAEAQSSRDCVSAYSTTGVWCQAPDSHRDAVRFELTRYANSRQLGGTHGRTRTDTSRFRKSASAPSAWVWRPELDSNQRRRLRRPSTGPPAGAKWSGRTESNRPVPRWQRCRAPCAPAGW